MLGEPAGEPGAVRKLSPLEIDRSRSGARRSSRPKPPGPLGLLEGVVGVVGVGVVGWRGPRGGGPRSSNPGPIC